jgi:rhamnose utilization protein RhaD (predicted bifunctional aldolase and dehydrogenase)
MRWTSIPYRRPGVPLTRAVAERVGDGAEAPEVLLLQNHGLVVAAEDCQRAEALLDEVERRLHCFPRTAPEPDHEALERGIATGPWRLPAEGAVHNIATDPVSLRFARGGALYPDHVVFLGPVQPEMAPGETPAQATEAWRKRFGEGPGYLVWPGHGVLVSSSLTAGAEAMLGCLTRVLGRLAESASPTYLTDDEVAALAGWEAETYRQALDRERRHG